MLKKFIYANILVILALTTGQANAQRYDIVTKISKIRYHTNDNILAPTWVGHLWITITSPGDLINSNCGKYESEYHIAITPNDKDALAIALTAKGLNANVRITVDDSEILPDSSSCKLQYITLY